MDLEVRVSMRRMVIIVALLTASLATAMPPRFDTPVRQAVSRTFPELGRRLAKEVPTQVYLALEDPATLALALKDRQPALHGRIADALDVVFQDVEDARMRGRSHGVVVELQLPRSFLRRLRDGEIALVDGLIDTLAPFVRRVGHVAFDSAALAAEAREDDGYLRSPARIRWPSKKTK